MFIKNHKKITFSVTAALMAGVMMMSFAGCADNSKDTAKTAESTTTAAQTKDNKTSDALSLWTDTAKLKTELTGYMKSITEEGGKDFIPVEDRIAVFDLDGTLFCETDPVYFDYRLLYHRVTEDEDYKDNATIFERETAEKIKTYMETGEQAEGLEVDHGKAVASSFAGMTVDEFENYVKEFKKQPAPSYEGMTNGEAFYKPMVEVVDYLIANEFKVYIVSGTDRLIVRGIVDGGLNIPPSQVIGSDETIVATNQRDVDGLDYVYEKSDDIILGGDFIVKNLKMNKVSVIAQEIGQQPVLAFGNSSGDASMAEYVLDDNKYKSMAVMLCCDDTERENGNPDKAQSMKETCEDKGWIAVSMKNDWKTIYGDKVTKK